MENNELQKIWKSIGTEVNYRSKDELNLLLKSKAKHTVRKFLILEITGVFLCIPLIIWLIYSSINRKDDIIYLINNAAAAIITVSAFIYGVISVYKLQNRRYDQPLKYWLEERIKFLSRGYEGRFKNLYIFLVPIMILTVFLSMHVYYEYKPFVEALRTEESIVRQIIAISIGLLVAFYIVRKINKHSLTSLEFLKDMYNRLCNER
jgi:hypothetical protein